MALATVSDLEALGFTRFRLGVAAADWDAFAAKYIARASRLVQRDVGATAYADAELAVPTDAVRAADLADAEAYRACALLADFWLAKLGSTLGDFQAAKSRIAVGKDAIGGQMETVAALMQHYDTLVEPYVSLSPMQYAAPEDLED